MLYKNGLIFANGMFQRLDLRTKKNVIAEMGENLLPEDKEEVMDCQDCYVIPGLVDIHTHGCMGQDFSLADEQGLEIMNKYYASMGITTVLATTMTNQQEKLEAAYNALGNWMDVHKEDSVIKGVYMEGPFFKKEKKGAHDARYLIPPNKQYLEKMNALCHRNIKVVAIDPLYSESVDFIRENKDYIYSLAHTACDYNQAQNMFQLGVNHVTHLFNAMNGLEHRAPGIPGAVIDNGNCFAELICDGIHIHPSLIRTLFQLIPDRLVLISDSMSATGLSDGNYELGGQAVKVQDGKATLADGTIAGSTTNLLEMMKRVISFGVPPEKAILSATYIPALSVNMEDQMGSLLPGRKADLLVLDREWNLKPLKL